MNPNMSNPKDLLYTNRFIPEEILNEKTIQTDAENFMKYETIRKKEINNVQEYLNDKVFDSSNLTQQKYKSQGWNKGDLANQRPILSDTVKDMVSDTYFQYKISYINIDSRQRDFSKYLKPNNYQMYLNKQFENVILMRLIDYNFPNLLFPINNTNNVIVWYTPSNTILINPYHDESDVTEFHKNNPKCQESKLYDSYYYFRLGKMSQYSFKIYPDQDPNSVYNCTYKLVIPPGYYNTETLARAIEDEWSKQLFFSSMMFKPEYSNVECNELPDKTCESVNPDDIMFPNTPQLMKVFIDPVTNKVDFLLRLEEIKIKKLQSYRGKNYIDLTLDLETTTFAEFQVLCNNYNLPIVPTGFPSIGGINKVQINKIEFVPKCYVHRQPNYSYYSFLENVECSCDSQQRIIRLYLYNLRQQCILASHSHIIESECGCDLLAEAVIGREYPFMFYTQVTEFITKYYKNNISILLNYFCNVDDSSKSLLNILGYEMLVDNTATISAVETARGINTNLDITISKFTQTIQQFYVILTRKNASLFNENNANQDTELIYAPPNTPPKVLHLYRGEDGKYYFFNTDYIFLRLMSTQYGGTLGGICIQASANSSDNSNVGGSTAIYDNTLNYIDGVNFKTINDISNSNLSEDLFKLFNNTTAKETVTTYEKSPPILAIKDISNLFCKIRISNVPQSGTPYPLLVGEIEYYNNTIIKLDTVTIQFVDFEGKILDLRFDHNFVVMIVEKVEILKETNINARTGFINNVGNSYTFTR